MAPIGHQLHSSKVKKLTGKQPKARVQRYLKRQDSQLVEGARAALLMKGMRCSDAMATVLKDMRAMKAPHSKLLLKNNTIAPFEEEGMNSIEFLTTKNDASLFCVASTNKKRPNNLIMGRTFDRRVLDMVELGVLYYKSITDYKLAPKKRPGSKPLLQFVGDRWNLDREMHKLQNLLIDFYRGDPVDKMILKGLDHILTFTVSEQPTNPMTNTSQTVVHMRTHHVKLKKNPNPGDSSNTPVPFLVPCGPDMDFVMKRTQFAAPDVRRLALKQPKENKKKKVKNHKTNIFGETIGRLHLEKQDIDKMGGKKSKALKTAEKIEKQEEIAKLESELEREKKEEGEEFKQTFGVEKEDR